MKPNVTLRAPPLAGIIDRRILVNFRCAPEIASRLLPAPFTPKQVNGFAVVGICLIRLKGMRPAWLPDAFGTGLSSENMAHRIAVEWPADGASHDGVFIIRRETSSRVNALVGGRLFAGFQRRARFEVWESAERFKIAVRSIDGPVSDVSPNAGDPIRVRLAARLEPSGLQGSIFDSLEAASTFFKTGSVGWSPGRHGGLDGMELRTSKWDVQALTVERIESSFFEDPVRFPPGSLTFDNALLMRKVDHEWHQREWSGPVA